MRCRRRRNSNLDDILDLGFTRVLNAIATMGDALMALADTIAQLAAEDEALRADADAILALLRTEAEQIIALQEQIAQLQGDAVTPEQLAALQQIATDLTETHNNLASALPPPVING